jgi:hypothetical protein
VAEKGIESHGSILYPAAGPPSSLGSVHKLAYGAVNLKFF